MKKAFLLCIVLTSLFAAPTISLAAVAETKHNFSVSPGTKEASDICAFCHTPHNANPATSRWNLDVSYTMYNSEYLERVDRGYEVPTELGFFPDPGYRSRLCLSCHDGTVAIGGVYKVGGRAATITVWGGVTTVPSTSPASLGTDLTDDHPVAIIYDPDATITFDYGTRTIELNRTLPSHSRYKEINLYHYASSTKGYVECTSCHDPHNNTYGKFLKTPNYPDAALCTTCHEKTNWIGSIHQTSTQIYPESPFGSGSTVGLTACMSCHKTHGGKGYPYLLTQYEEETCFNGTSIACHGSSGIKNIKDVIDESNFSRHPTTKIEGVHTNLDVLYPSGGTPPGSKGLTWTNSRHAECVDCHNPHQARRGTHNIPSDSTGWYPLNPNTSTNYVSNALLGVPGIEPVNEPLWSDIGIDNYRTMNKAEYEYQICFKCHSSYALENIGTPVSFHFPTFSGATVTDQAWEFSKGNKSVHPVRVGLNSQTGSDSPRALRAGQMSSPWTNVGSQTMYCSDCHGANNEDSLDPRGPHGSRFKFMLKGNAKYWPTRSDGINLWTLRDLGSIDADNNLFCINCHPNTRNRNNVHSVSIGLGGGHQDIACVECHVAVPHGSKRSRLIGYESDPAPYDYNDRSLKITEFRKAIGPNNYTAADCQANCHTIHSDFVAGAEP